MECLGLNRSTYKEEKKMMRSTCFEDLVSVA